MWGVEDEEEDEEEDDEDETGRCEVVGWGAAWWAWLGATVVR